MVSLKSRVATWESYRIRCPSVLAQKEESQNKTELWPEGQCKYHHSW